MGLKKLQKNTGNTNTTTMQQLVREKCSVIAMRLSELNYSATILHSTASSETGQAVSASVEK